VKNVGIIKILTFRKNYVMISVSLVCMAIPLSTALFLKYY